MCTFPMQSQATSLSKQDTLFSNASTTKHTEHHIHTHTPSCTCTWHVVCKPSLVSYLSKAHHTNLHLACCMQTQLWQLSSTTPIFVSYLPPHQYVACKPNFVRYLCNEPSHKSALGMLHANPALSHIFIRQYPQICTWHVACKPSLWAFNWYAVWHGAHLYISFISHGFQGLVAFSLIMLPHQHFWCHHPYIWQINKCCRLRQSQCSEPSMSYREADKWSQGNKQKKARPKWGKSNVLRSAHAKSSSMRAQRYKVIISHRFNHNLIDAMNCRWAEDDWS